MQDNDLVTTSSYVSQVDCGKAQFNDYE